MPHDHHTLIGMPGSRSRLSTPTLVLDLDVLEANIAAMASLCAEHHVALRPHAKVHKSVEIARRQIAAGAIGVCCATIGEAEAMAAGGISSILVTGPLATADKVARLARLLEQGADIMVVTDDPIQVALLGEAVPSDMRLEVLVDVECGSRRTGVVGADRSVSLAQQIAATPRLRFGGIHAYDGSVQGIADYDARSQQINQHLKIVRETIGALADVDLAPERIAGSGTGSHDIESRLALFTEIHAGSYVFLDSFYGALPLTQDGRSALRTSLSVRSSVVSGTHSGFAIVDAGFKALAPDSQIPTIHSGAPAGATYAFMGDEFGKIAFATPNERLEVGSAVEIAAPYCATTVNLYDHYCCVRADTVVDIWPIDARGYS